MNYSLTKITSTIPTTRAGFLYASIRNKVYIFGGNHTPSQSSPNNYTETNEINVYDIKNNTYVTLPVVLPTNLRSVAAICSVGYKIYFFGRGNTSITVFDTKKNTFTTLDTKLPEAAYDRACGVVGTKIYLLSGSTASNRWSDKIILFDTESNTATMLDETVYGYESVYCAAVGTKLYLFGGVKSYYGSNTNAVWVYDTESNVVDPLLDTALPLQYCTQGGVIGTKVYLFGGYATKDSAYQDTIIMFDTETNEFTTLDLKLPKPCNTRCVSIGEKCYLIGCSGKYLIDNNVYAFSDGTESDDTEVDILKRYADELKFQRDDLVDNLLIKHIDANKNETFNDLIPKVLDVAISPKEYKMHYGVEPPTDTSLLWVKTDKIPNKIYVTHKLSNEAQGYYTKLDVSFTNSIYYAPSFYINNKIYLCYVSPVLVFDPETDTCTSKTINNISRTSALIGEKIYSINYTYDRDNSKYITNIYIYDTVSDTHTVSASTLTCKTEKAVASSYDTKVYVFGGLNSGSIGYTSKIHVYDTVSDTVTVSSTTVNNKICYGIEKINDKCYLFGGGGSGTTKLNTIYIFDFVSETITTSSVRLPYAMDNTVPIKCGDNIYIFSYSSDSINKYQGIIIFDPIASTKSYMQSSNPEAYSGIYLNDKFYLFCKNSIIKTYEIGSRLDENNLLLKEDTSKPIRDLIDVGALSISVPVGDAYLGNVDNAAMPVKIAVHNGTDWEEIN